MDNMKKVLGGAGTFFQRAVQYTEEKLGTSEKTEFDAHFDNLSSRAETTRKWTEKLSADVQSVLIPNPANRLEDYVSEKVERKRPDRLTNLEWLGLDMISSGNDFGPGTTYGSALLKVGACQQRMGCAERDFIGSGNRAFVQPMSKFLEGEMKSILREKKILEIKRLDLDAAKNRLRKARSMETQQAAERELSIAQLEFDKQTEIVKLLLEGISSFHTTQLRSLNDFVESQLRFHSQCTSLLEELSTELNTMSLSPSSSLPHDASSSSPPAGVPLLPETEGEGLRKIRVLYDFDAKSPDELSLLADEFIHLIPTPNGGGAASTAIPTSLANPPPGYCLAKRGHQMGFVPKAFLEKANKPGV